MSITEPDEIKLNMTAMIDIVFQLLVFFIMTFKVVAMEGDFDVKMPLASKNPEQSIDQVFPDLISVKILAGTNGNINSIIVDDNETFSDEDMYKNLTRLIEERITAEGDPEKAAETEVEFDIAYGLKYRYTVQAIESVSGRILPDGSVKKLIQKVKFKDSKKSL
jgi:biopolymer transport protein ExbD